MRINDPLRMNDWDIKHFLSLVLAVQAAVLLVLGLRSDGIDLPLIGQIVLFVYLAFIPGTLILRACRVHNLGAAVSLLYSVGLSLMALMSTGFFLNMSLPLLGYSRPIALFTLTVATTALVLALCIISYLRDRDFKCDSTVDIRSILSPQALLLMLVPFLSIFGTYLMNSHGGNFLLLAMIAAVALIVLLVGFNILVPRELYPLAIFVIAIALLFHNSLISDNLIGWDIHQEKYLADSIVHNGYWQFSTDYILNSMLSIVMLAPILSIFLNMDVTWVYKIIFPLFFALVPLALYQVYRKQSDDRMAFMATVFFVSLVVFFTEMLQLARQEIAELFLALVILLIVDRSMEKKRWTFLFLAFALGLAMSHYGLTFIFIATIALGWALVYVVSKLRRDTVRDMNRRLGPLLIVALMAFCAIWYIYTSSSNPFTTVIDITHRIEEPLEATAVGLLKPEAPAVTPAPGTTPATTPAPGKPTPVPTPAPAPVTTQPIQLITTGGDASLLHRMFLYLMLTTQGLLAIGLLAALLAQRTMRIRREYYALAFVNMLMLGVSLVLPNFADSLNTTRVYQIALIILAPFFVLGWVGIFKALGRATKRSMAGTLAVAMALLSIFLVLYLIFNTGVIFEVAKDVPMSYSLDQQGANVSYTIYNPLEKAGAEWTIDVQGAIARSQNMTYIPPIFSDTYRWLFLQDWNTSRSYMLRNTIANTPRGAYIYLGTYNVLDNLAVLIGYVGQTKKTQLLNLTGIKSRNKIYANGGSEVYY
jgi:uncharacterized membrane protein